MTTRYISYFKEILKPEIKEKFVLGSDLCIGIHSSATVREVIDNVKI